MNMSDHPFHKIDTGKVDSNGNPIKCGDRILYYERIPGYVLVSAQDAFGRVVKIDPNDQIVIQSKERNSTGTVAYNPDSAGFCVEFDDHAVSWGGKCENLAALCEKHQWNETKITVIG